jgi:hypothetical protein
MSDLQKEETVLLLDDICSVILACRSRPLMVVVLWMKLYAFRDPLTVVSHNKLVVTHSPQLKHFELILNSAFQFLVRFF